MLASSTIRIQPGADHGEGSDLPLEMAGLCRAVGQDGGQARPHRRHQARGGKTCRRQGPLSQSRKAHRRTLVHDRRAALARERRQFQEQLAQGDPLNRRSTHVPRGRGPFKSWEAGAYDALVTLKKLNKVIDWRLEKYSITASATTAGAIIRGLPSPYIWGGSTIQRRGKFVADGKFSSTT